MAPSPCLNSAERIRRRWEVGEYGQRVASANLYYRVVVAPLVVLPDDETGEFALSPELHSRLTVPPPRLG